MKTKSPLPIYSSQSQLIPDDKLLTQPSDINIKKQFQRNVYIETYGCQMNVSDSELMTGILTQAGHRTVSDIDDADVILLNTCAIRENAETKVINRLEHLNHKKRREGNLIIGVCGCMAQHLRDKILDAAPYVDLVMGPDAYRNLPMALNAVVSGDPFLGLQLDKSEDYADIAPIRKEGIRAWLTIQRGCDKMCTFCIVPFVRGRERSIPLKILTDDVKRLVEEGFKEIVLLGQTVNSYHDGNHDFGELLWSIAEVDGVERVRFTSPHPADATDSMIDAMENCPEVCNQLHLPLQSGSTQVLQRMRRTYTAEQYRELVSKIRDKIPQIAISTDVIVGFCEETEKDFKQTYELMEEIRFDSAFMFKYSDRDGTLANKMLPDDVPEKEKAKRLNEIINLQEKISGEINQSKIGTTVPVLIEGDSRRNADQYHGKTDTFKTTVFPKEETQVGDIVNVKIHSATAHTLIGDIVR
ncbi:MAG: tRNA (N6-isopentenyl adenosine(37)-C2)-methylthiotransferase MiaB [Candidatus Poribacteria bacterium]|nr:tRNA (N6-isopentenyl adenosine(37)-C2)-methylthiotransferase MiaB [Candidatus Poribacteria bacterium]